MRISDQLQYDQEDGSINLPSAIFHTTEGIAITYEELFININKELAKLERARLITGTRVTDQSDPS